jgi:integrase
MASIRKRVWGPNKENKAWVVDYKDQKGKRVLKTFATEKDAKAWSVNALHEVQLGTHTRASASKTVTEAWLLWLDQGDADGLEFGTIRSRRQHLKVHVQPSIGHLRLSDLTTPLLYDFDKKLRDKGTSIAMRRKILTSLKTMLSFAQGRGLVAQNVARGVRIKSDARESSRGPLRAGVDFPTMAELNSLIENSTPRRRPFIVTAIFTGMRLSELRGSKSGKRDIPLAPVSSIRSSNGGSIAPRANSISYSRITGERSSACGTSTNTLGIRYKSHAASP